jgi:hypothetical protein
MNQKESETMRPKRLYLFIKIKMEPLLKKLIINGLMIYNTTSVENLAEELPTIFGYILHLEQHFSSPRFLRPDRRK